MRYTLRLLTLDQLGRAAGLVCALELEREADPARYGRWPIEIGLWVGKAATPNVMGRRGDGRSDTARSKTRQFKSDPGTPMPIPLESCPWCGTRFEPASLTLLPDDDQPSELRIVCANFECDFSGDRPLPVLAVDEPIYRRLPAFLIATVDKFASLPFTGETGVLLGGADRFDGTGFYGAAEPREGSPLQRPLDGPDLVIQDELHLISGPLGTMVGLYETAIEALCVQAAQHPADGSEGAARSVRPKIVASTATVRQAQDQIQALFARSLTEVFPPPGPDRRDSFFAQVVPLDRVPGRMYLGIANNRPTRRHPGTTQSGRTLPTCHHSSRDFTCSSCSMATVVVTGHSSRRSTPPRWTPTGDGLQRGQFCWPPLGRTVGRQRAATWPPLGRISWPPTPRAHTAPTRALLPRPHDAFVHPGTELLDRRREHPSITEPGEPPSSPMAAPTAPLMEGSAIRRPLFMSHMRL